VIQASKYSEKVQAKGLVTDGMGAVHFAALRNCKVVPTKGQEFVRTCKLTENTSTCRIYTSCCGTPLGLDGGGKLTIIHPQLLKLNPNKTNGQEDLTADSLKPSHCVHYSSAPEGAAPIPKHVKPTDGAPLGLAFQFLAYSMSGMFAKKTKGLLGGPNVEPTIGIDSIVVE